MSFFGKLKYLVRYSPEELYEFYSATVAMLWGLFQFFPQHSAFGITNRVILNIYANQEYFGIVALFFGLGYMITIFNELEVLKKNFNILLAVGWMYVTILYFANNPTSTSVVIYGSWAIFNALTFLRQ